MNATGRPRFLHSDPSALPSSSLTSLSLLALLQRLDTEQEVITLVSERTIGLEDLPSQVPADSPRWHFFLYTHSHEGQTLDSLVFIYSMPGSNCTIKERMLYSSCKAPFIASVEQQMGLEIAKKVEIDAGSELTADYLQDQLHPPKHAPPPHLRQAAGPLPLPRGPPPHRPDPTGVTAVSAGRVGRGRPLPGRRKGAWCRELKGNFVTAGLERVNWFFLWWGGCLWDGKGCGNYRLNVWHQAYFGSQIVEYLDQCD
ncbi:twinfilin-1-like [Hypanus sabinus]|uniref:twinfilin-1-like n=1 Tax=Hypanus sabinus TaxID=79690 RepID=UPI0028C4CB99|nr:twinfilin-1-like [Hypanus sabinus]